MDYHHVVEARYVRDFVVWLRFRDGTAREVDLRRSRYSNPTLGSARNSPTSDSSTTTANPPAGSRLP